MEPSDLDILVVDDHEMMRTLLVRALTKAGVQRVRTADNGIEALSLLKDRAAHLIITDNQMPGMGGLELSAKVRADQTLGTPKIIIVSGIGSTAFTVEAMNAGVDAVLMKPIALDELMAAINKLFAV